MQKEISLTVLLLRFSEEDILKNASFLAKNDILYMFCHKHANTHMLLI